MAERGEGAVLDPAETRELPKPDLSGIPELEQQASVATAERPETDQPENASETTPELAEAKRQYLDLKTEFQRIWEKIVDHNEAIDPVPEFFQIRQTYKKDLDAYFKKFTEGYGGLDDPNGLFQAIRHLETNLLPWANSALHELVAAGGSPPETSERPPPLPPEEQARIDRQNAELRERDGRLPEQLITKEESESIEKERAERDKILSGAFEFLHKNLHENFKARYQGPWKGKIGQTFARFRSWMNGENRELHQAAQLGLLPQEQRKVNWGQKETKDRGTKWLKKVGLTALAGLPGLALAASAVPAAATIFGVALAGNALARGGAEVIRSFLPKERQARIETFNMKTAMFAKAAEIQNQSAALFQELQDQGTSAERKAEIQNHLDQNLIYLMNLAHEKSIKAFVGQAGAEIVFEGEADYESQEAKDVSEEFAARHKLERKAELATDLAAAAATFGFGKLGHSMAENMLAGDAKYGSSAVKEAFNQGKERIFADFNNDGTSHFVRRLSEENITQIMQDNPNLSPDFAKSVVDSNGWVFEYNTDAGGQINEAIGQTVAKFDGQTVHALGSGLSADAFSADVLERITPFAEQLGRDRLAADVAKVGLDLWRQVPWMTLVNLSMAAAEADSLARGKIYQEAYKKYQAEHLKDYQKKVGAAQDRLKAARDLSSPPEELGEELTLAEIKEVEKVAAKIKEDDQISVSRETVLADLEKDRLGEKKAKFDVQKDQNTIRAIDEIIHDWVNHLTHEQLEAAGIKIVNEDKDDNNWWRLIRISTEEGDKILRVTQAGNRSYLSVTQPNGKGRSTRFGGEGAKKVLHYETVVRFLHDLHDQLQPITGPKEGWEEDGAPADEEPAVAEAKEEVDETAVVEESIKSPTLEVKDKKLREMVPELYKLVSGYNEKYRLLSEAEKAALPIDIDFADSEDEEEKFIAVTFKTTGETFDFFPTVEAAELGGVEGELDTNFSELQPYLKLLEDIFAEPAGTAPPAAEAKEILTDEEFILRQLDSPETDRKLAERELYREDREALFNLFRRFANQWAELTDEQRDQLPVRFNNKPVIGLPNTMNYYIDFRDGDDIGETVIIRRDERGTRFNHTTYKEDGTQDLHLRPTLGEYVDVLRRVKEVVGSLGEVQPAVPAPAAEAPTAEPTKPKVTKPRERVKEVERNVHGTTIEAEGSRLRPGFQRVDDDRADFAELAEIDEEAAEEQKAETKEPEKVEERRAEKLPAQPLTQELLDGHGFMVLKNEGMVAEKVAGKMPKDDQKASILHVPYSNANLGSKTVVLDVSPRGQFQLDELLPELVGLQVTRHSPLQMVDRRAAAETTDAAPVDENPEPEADAVPESPADEPTTEEAAPVEEQADVEAAESPAEQQVVEPTPPENFRLGPALWRNNSHDVPIVVTGYYGEKDGKHYVKIEGTNTVVELENVIYPDEGTEAAPTVEQPETKPSNDLERLGLEKLEDLKGKTIKLDNAINYITTSEGKLDGELNPDDVKEDSELTIEDAGADMIVMRLKGATLTVDAAEALPHITQAK